MGKWAGEVSLLCQHRFLTSTGYRISTLRSVPQFSCHFLTAKKTIVSKCMTSTASNIGQSEGSGPASKYMCGLVIHATNHSPGKKRMKKNPPTTVFQKRMRLSCKHRTCSLLLSIKVNTASTGTQLEKKLSWQALRYIELHVIGIVCRRQKFFISVERKITMIVGGKWRTFAFIKWCALSRNKMAVPSPSLIL